MRLLLDTHSFLWFIAGSAKLSERARVQVEDLDNAVYLSVASLWEIAIKVSIGKLSLSRPYEELIPEQLEHNEIEVLTINLEHLAVLTRLPLHHRDPFDRLIITQAMVEDLPIVGKDDDFERYPVRLIW